MTRLFHRLRFRLIFLILCGTLLVSGLMAYTSFEEKRWQIARMKENVFRMAQLISHEDEQLVAGTRQLLIVFSHLPTLYNGNSYKCGAIFSSLSS